MPLKIFVGDDSFAIRKLAEISGEGKEWELRFFDTTDDLIEQVKEEKPDIIFLSIDLSGRSVLSIAEEIKTDEETKEIPIVLLKGAFFEQENDERVKYFDKILEKPFSPDDFGAVVLELTTKNIEAPESEAGFEEDFNTPEDVKNAFDDSSDFSDLTLPEEESEKEEQAEKEETITEEKFEEFSGSGVGVYPVSDEEVQPNDEETVESGGVKIESFKEEDMDFENPFDGGENEETKEELIEEDVSLEKKEATDIDEDEKLVFKEEEEEIFEEKEKQFAEEVFEQAITGETTEASKGETAEEKTAEDKEEEIDIHEVPTQKIKDEKEEPIISGIAKEELNEIIEKKIEEILWDILPDITEKIVKEEIEKIKKEITSLEE